jgi:hypothetical protein
MNKAYNVKIQSVKMFIKLIVMSHRVSTHITPNGHKETEEESHHFILTMRNKVVVMDPNCVIQLDWTPIPYLYHASHTLEEWGVKTVHVRSLTTDMKCTTLAATVLPS